MKVVAVVLRAAPSAGDRLAEGLRNAVGSALERGNRVTVYLVGPAVDALGNPAGDLRRPLEALRSMRTRIVVEAGSLASAGGIAVESLPRERIFAEISAADAVVSW